jgi:catechol 2,3-dioxygenase-like lactoylglutathione lyase family enzyme
MGRSEGSVGSAVPVFRVASVARSAAWYADVLGFVADSVGSPDDPVFSILRRDGAELMLQKVREGVGSARSARVAGGGWDAYLRIDDADAFRSAIQGKVLELGPIVLRDYGCRELELTDPDGHVIVLGECG